MKVLFLCDKKYYDHKMSRVRFHSIEALAQRADVELLMSGPNWINWDSSRPAQQNINHIYGNKNTPDIVVGYKPLEILGFSQILAPKCIRYNEMYDVQWTIKEMLMSRAKYVICHHENDYHKYVRLMANYKNHGIELFHIAHCAEKSIFKNYELPKKYDLFLGGATNGVSILGKHYPLRDRMVGILGKMSKQYNCYLYRHPGYNLGDALSNKYAIDFAKQISQSKIAVTCSGKPKSRFGKYIEIPMCGTALAADLPEEDQENFKKFMIEIDMAMTDEQIINKLAYYLDNDEKRQDLVSRGLEWSKNYTHEKYAERFVNYIGAAL